MTTQQPLRIGLLVGREWSFPPAFIEQVNNRDQGVIAEYVKLGGTVMNEPSVYSVIVDRISHEIPYYRTYLKNAVLQGVAVVNDPFMWSSDDKYFGASLTTQMGVAHPKTIALPNKDYIPGIVHSESLRNLVYPLDWDWILSYIALPCVLKDAHGGGWKDVYICHSRDELIYHYNHSGLLTMIVQEFIHWENYARCMCLGQDNIYVMKYDPKTRIYHEQHDFSPALYDRLIQDCLKIVRATGYDMNTCEFAIRDGIPYAIDFMNPAPDMDVNSLGRKHFDWMVKNMADMCIRLAQEGQNRVRDRYVWAQVVNQIQESPDRVLVDVTTAAATAPARVAKAPKTPKTTVKVEAGESSAKPKRGPRAKKDTASE
jgi:hypothetical protein